MLFETITAPSCNGVFGVNKFTINCGDTSESIFTPLSIISFIFMSLSITISPPVFVLASSVVAITTLYTSSFVFVSKSLSIPKYLVNLFVPNCSNILRNSGANITISAITPYGINAVNIKFNILSCKASLIAVIIKINKIPFYNCHILDFFA